MASLASVPIPFEEPQEVKHVQDRVYKILVIGPGGSGKTSYINKVVTGDETAYAGDDNLMTLPTPHGNVKFSFDQEHVYSTDYAAVFIFYDCNSPRRLDASFYLEAKQACPLVTVVVGNKTDLVCRYVEQTVHPSYHLSTSTGVGLFSPFRAVVEAIIASQEPSA